MSYIKLSDTLKKFSNCRYCKHFNDDGTCEAFPKAIPLSILNGTFNHYKKHKDDHGIRFEVDEEKVKEEDKWSDKYSEYSKFFEEGSRISREV